MSSERQQIDIDNPWWGEHTFRYQYVSQHMVRYENVLDIACGNGYGSNHLAQYTQGFVVGGDISEDTVDFCKSTWSKENLNFMLLNGTNLNLGKDSQDILVSFETIEHTTEYVKMLEEFYRVIKPSGTLFLSTPNILINSPKGIVVNPYHTQEFTYDELFNIVNSLFSKFEIYGQAYIRYTYHNSIRFKFTNLLERILYLRGLRKTPLKLKDIIFKILINRPFYPVAEDYELVNDSLDQIKRCKTFFVICKKE